MKVVLIRLRRLFQDMGIPTPKEFVKPGGVNGAGREGVSPFQRDPGCQFGDGENVLTGQDRLQGFQRICVFIGQFLIVQTCET